MLPSLDEPPEDWGPDHDELVLDPEEILRGNVLGARTREQDDEDDE